MGVERNIFDVYLRLCPVAIGNGLVVQHDQFYELVTTTVTPRTYANKYGHGISRHVRD